MFRTQEKKQTLEDLSKSIILITGDDQYLSKIAMKTLSELYHDITNENLASSPNEKDEPCNDFFSYVTTLPIFSELLNETSSVEINHSKKSYKISDGGAKVLRSLQKHAERKLKCDDLIRIAKDCAKKANVTLTKRTRKVKARLLEWFFVNWDKIEPYSAKAVIDALHIEHPDSKEETGENGNQNQNTYDNIAEPVLLSIDEP